MGPTYGEARASPPLPGGLQGGNYGRVSFNLRAWVGLGQRGKRVGLAVLLACGAAGLSWCLIPKPELYAPGLGFSRALEDRTGRVIHVALTPDEKYRLRTRLDEISPDLVAATLLLEDQHFREHPGVNPFSMLRSLAGVCTGTRRGGGSTITMQLARQRFHLETRSLAGKLEQICRSLQLERHYTKDQILEAYLNVISYGGNVEGIGAAALLWCGKGASDLTAREAVSLSVIPQSPARRRPRAHGENPALASAHFRLWQRWQESRGGRSDPLDANFVLRPESSVPREAPHLARRLLSQAASGARCRATIRMDRQQTVERTIQDFLFTRREAGFRNACALLVHAPSREVLAYVGSASFLDHDICGQVDGIQAKRSPGSALKPFIYALAMQQGLLHPRTLVRDGPAAFGDYNPENFDRGFAGPIAAEDALFRSRNIPAVWLASRLAAPGLYGFLKRAGVSLAKPAEYYGLALPLGGAEIRMEELAALYAMLADDGCARGLQLEVKSMSPAAPGPLLCPEARFLIRRMLASREEEQGLNDPTISWKTGTSHGFRDAWAVGLRGEYLLVVWMGNFDGRANPNLIARRCAAPLLFACFQRLNLPYRGDLAPPGVSEVQLCAVSGQLPSPHCHHRRMGWFIPGVSPIAPCTIHREVLLDAKTGFRVAADDGRRELRREVFEFWPAEMLALFRAAGVPRRDVPPLEPMNALRLAGREEAPRITSPQTRLIYAVQASNPARQSIPLRVNAPSGVRTVFWFAGTTFLGSAAPGAPLWWKPSPGDWKLHVLDDQGRSDSCEVKVEVVP